MVLHDGIALVQKDYGATKLIDMGTLTGAVIVALGDFYTGTFSNNDEFAQKLIEAGQSQGEKFWQMPMSEDYDEMISSKFADIANLGHGGSVGDKTADSIMGAKIIGTAVENDRPWIHLDVAGTAWDMNVRPYRGVGAIGIAIKTLVKLIGEQ
jgi:leucyl aminopeptidase